MALTMKERYARLDTSKLPEVFNERFNSIKAKTDNFSDEDVLDIWEKPFNALYGIVEAKHPEAIRKGGTVTKEKSARVKVVKAKGPKSKPIGSTPEIIAEVFDDLSKSSLKKHDRFESLKGLIERDEYLTNEQKKDLYEYLMDYYKSADTTSEEGYHYYTDFHNYIKDYQENNFKNKPEVPASLRKKLSAKTIEQIEAAIWEANYANKLHKESDTALTESLMKDFGLSKGQAEKWVAKREVIGTIIGTGYDYSKRTAIKKAARKDIKVTRDGVEVDRKSPKNAGKTFYDDKGEAWKCLEYNAKLDSCMLENADGKKQSTCIEGMYTTNPVTKREKGNMVDECRETLKEAGYSVREHAANGKKIKRSAPRPEKAIIKERVEDTFTPIMKDLKGSEEKEKENKATIEILESIQGLFSKFMNRISNLADDGKIEQLKKIEKLLKEIVD